MKYLKYTILLLIPLLFMGCSSVAVVPNEMNTLDYNTKLMHEGKLYTTSTKVNINSGQTIYIKANSSNSVHLIERLITATTTGSNLEYTITLYENGTDTAATNELTNFNVNRKYLTDNITFKIYTSVTGFSCSTGCVELPFGNEILSDKKFSNTAISTTEYILRSDTNYYLGITNNDGGVLTLNLRWLFYEE